MAADYQNEAYLAMMWHINSWAIPQGISEADALEQVKQQAASLREAKSGDELLETSKWCIANRPE